jgi:glycolate oxidase
MEAIRHRPAIGLDRRCIAELEDVVGRDHVLVEPAEREPFASDATAGWWALPDAVVLPGSTEEVAGVVATAARFGVAITPRGSGTSLSAGAVPISAGIVCSLARMNRVLEVASVERLARVQPGVRAAELERVLEPLGLFFAPDPGSQRIATLGGMVATCAGGLRGAKHGVVRDHVLGLEVVLGNAEVVRTGGRLRKDVAGYDLTRLLVGSEGTLGIVTEATLGLTPIPPTSAAAVAYFRSVDDAGRAVERILGAGLQPSMVELLDRTCIEAVEESARLGLRLDAGALLLLGEDGDPASVEAGVETMVGLARQAGALETVRAASPAEHEALLAARRCTLPSLARLGGRTILEDASVPVPAVPEMVKRIAEIAERRGLRLGVFGHAGDGNLHPTCMVPLDEPEAMAAAEAGFAEVFQAAIDLGGTISGEHGIGAAKLPYLEAQLGPAQMELLRRVKAAFDPAGILNPGKLGS